MTMRAAFGWLLGAMAGLGGFIAADAPVLAQETDYGGLPAGEHRELVFAVCHGCHSVKLVTQQGMTRKKWDSTLTWMVEKQGMPRLDPATEAAILDYLSTHFGVESRGTGTANNDGLSPYNTSVQPLEPAQ
jgi:hypothetical protein